MANFLQSLGLGLGRQMIYDRQREAEDIQLQGQRDTNALREQQLQQGQMQMQQQQELQAARKRMGTLLAGKLQADKEEVQSPLQEAKFYRQLEAEAISANDFDSAKTFGTTAREKVTEAKTTAELKAKEDAAAQQEFGAAASEHVTSPTPESAAALAQAAVKAGVNPLDIPPPGSPELLQWAKTKQTRGMDSASRVRLAQEAAKAAEDRALRKQQHDDDAAIKRGQLAILAQGQQSAAEDRRARRAEAAAKAPETIEVDGKIKQWDAGTRSWTEVGAATKNGVAGGAGGRGLATAKERDSIRRGIFGMGEFVDQLGQMSKMGATSTTGAFAFMKPGVNLTSAMAKVAGNLTTSADALMMGTAGSQLSSEYMRTQAALLGGGVVAQSAIDKTQVAMTPMGGEPVEVTAYKVAQSGRMARVVLNNIRSTDPEQQKHVKETLAHLNALGLPDPADIYDAVTKSKNPAALRGIASVQGSIKEAAQAIAAAKPAGKPAAPTAKPGLPAGWTVKEH